MFTPDFFKVGKIGDHSDLLTAEGQIDEILYFREPQLVGHPLELGGLSVIEAVQPLGQIVQLIKGDLCADQSVQDGIEAVQLIHLTILPECIADLQGSQQLYRAVIVLIGNGEGDRGLSIFRMLGVAQYHLEHISHFFTSAAMIVFPYRAISIALRISPKASLLTCSSSANSAEVMSSFPQ